MKPISSISFSPPKKGKRPGVPQDYIGCGLVWFFDEEGEIRSRPDDPCWNYAKFCRLEATKKKIIQRWFRVARAKE